MADIKTRETVKNVKVLDRASVAAEHMRGAADRIRTRAEHVSGSRQDSPTEYASDNLQSFVEDGLSEVGHAGLSTGVKAVEKGRTAFIQQKQRKQVDEAKTTRKGSLPKVEDESEVCAQPDPQGRKRMSSTTIKTKTRKSKTTAKPVDVTNPNCYSGKKASTNRVRRQVKTAQKSIKAANQPPQISSKATEKTAQAAKQYAVTTWRASGMAMRRAKAVAKTSALAFRATAHTAASAVKAVIAGTKSLVAAIAAGGWVAVAIVVVICVIAWVVASCFGIFFSNEGRDDELTMRQVVRTINEEYQNKLDDIKASVSYDVLEMSGSRAVWPEVLAVYAVKTTTDPEQPQEVATMTEEKQRLLEEIFWAMNRIAYDLEDKVETEIVETDDGNGTIIEEEVRVTNTYLRITVSHKTAQEQAEEYVFGQEQKEMLEKLLADKNNVLWSTVLYGIASPDGQIVAVALSQVGNIGGEPYWSWYGFSSHVEWCACFVSWCANECGYIENGIIPKFAGCVTGVRWFKERGQWADNSMEPSPGTLIFFDWDDPGGVSGPQDGLPDHVGIVEKVEGGRVYTIEGNSGDACRQQSYPVGYYEIMGYGIPLV